MMGLVVPPPSGYASVLAWNLDLNVLSSNPFQFFNRKKKRRSPSASPSPKKEKESPSPPPIKKKKSESSVDSMEEGELSEEELQRKRMELLKQLQNDDD